MSELVSSEMDSITKRHPEGADAERTPEASAACISKVTCIYSLLLHILMKVFRTFNVDTFCTLLAPLRDCSQIPHLFFVLNLKICGYCRPDCTVVRSALASFCLVKT